MSLLGPTKIKACKFFLYSLKVPLKLKITNRIICFLRICLLSKVEDEKIISQIVGISEDDQNGDRASKNDKSCRICIMRLKVVLLKYEKYGTVYL